MKRLDLLIMCSIGVAALVLGAKFAESIGKKTQHVYPLKLDNFATFDRKISHMMNAGEKYKEGEKDVVYTTAKHLYLRAEQWQWYPDIELSANSDYILHIATRDVQHSFHLDRSATGEMIDVLIQPNIEYQIVLKDLKPGIHAIGCTEYCGIAHNKMRGKLIIRE